MTYIIVVDCKAVAMVKHATLEEAYHCAVRHLPLYAGTGEHQVIVRDASYFHRETPQEAEKKAARAFLPSLGGIHTI